MRSLVLLVGLTGLISCSSNHPETYIGDTVEITEGTLKGCTAKVTGTTGEDHPTALAVDCNGTMYLKENGSAIDLYNYKYKVIRDK